MKHDSPAKQVLREQRSVIRWSLLHIATAVCLIVGIYYGREYMRMPDRVIVVDEAGSIYRGSSENVLCKETAENIARRCAFAFLDRSFEHDHRQLCEALFGRSAQKSLSDIIRKSKDEFTEQKIRQLPEIRKVELLPLSDAPGQWNQTVVVPPLIHQQRCQQRERHIDHKRFFQDFMDAFVSHFAPSSPVVLLSKMDFSS